MPQSCQSRPSPFDNITLPATGLCRKSAGNYGTKATFWRKLKRHWTKLPAKAQLAQAMLARRKNEVTAVGVIGIRPKPR